jgi:hypothetical protein
VVRPGKLLSRAAMGVTQAWISAKPHKSERLHIHDHEYVTLMSPQQGESVVPRAEGCRCIEQA